MDNLRLLREEKGLTQSQLAEKVDVTTGAIQQYEAGTNDPSVKVLVKLADIFNARLDYLIGRTTVRESLEDEDTQLAYQIRHMRNSVVKHAALQILKEVKQYI